MFSSSEQHDNALGLESARHESERIRGGLIEPVRIIDQAQDVLLDGNLTQEAEHRDCHNELVLHLPRRDRQCAPKRRRLHVWDQVDVVEDGPKKSVQRCKGQLHLRFHPDSLKDPQIGGAPKRVAE
jgi:hypothetical protein